METKTTVEKIKTCRACGSMRNSKWGSRRGKQCYRCCECGFQFTIESDRRSRLEVRRAITLYCLGFSFRTIGKLMSYHHTTILNWITTFAKENHLKPIPKAEIFVELEEMHHYIQSKKTNHGFGKYIDAQLDSLLTENVAIEIPKLLKECLTD